jgi:hypothetical protein
MVVSVKEKARLRIGSGMGHRDECKRTTDEVSKEILMSSKLGTVSIPG